MKFILTIPYYKETLTLYPIYTHSHLLNKFSFYFVYPIFIDWPIHKPVLPFEKFFIICPEKKCGNELILLFLYHYGWYHCQGRQLPL